MDGQRGADRRRAIEAAEEMLLNLNSVNIDTESTNHYLGPPARQSVLRRSES